MMDSNDYDLKPQEDKKPEAARPKPGEPGWVEPVPVIEKVEAVPFADSSPEVAFDSADIEKNKGIAILAYVLFIVPLVAAPQSKYARFHANQGLLVFILWLVAVVGVVVLHFMDVALWAFLDRVWILAAFFSCIFRLMQPALLLGMLALMIVGIIRAANGEGKGLPLIGHINLIR